MSKKLIFITIIIIFNNNTVLTSQSAQEDFFVQTVKICSDPSIIKSSDRIFDFEAINTIRTYINDVAPKSSKGMSFSGLFGYFVSNQYTNMAFRLISYIDINDNIMHDGNTPLVFCILNNLYQSLKMLLEQESCNINAQSSPQRITPLMAAILQNKYDLIDYLLARQDIDINIQDSESNSSIFYAIQSQQFQLIQKLIDKKAELNCFNAKKESPLIIAIKKQFIDAITIFIHTDRCNIELQNSDHKDARDITLELIIQYPNCLFQEIYKLLTKQNAPIKIAKLN